MNIVADRRSKFAFSYDELAQLRSLKGAVRLSCHGGGVFEQINFGDF